MSQFLDLELNRPASAAFLNVTLLGLAVLVLSLISAAILLNLYQKNKNDYQTIINALNQQDTPKKEVLKSPVIHVSANEVNQVNALIGVLATPWDELLATIEQSDLPDIALLSIEPNLKKQQLLLTGEAKNLPTALRYIQQLEAQPVLNEVYLQKHSIDEADVSKPVRFIVLAKWSVAK
ncbi:MAG: hypothetical protein V4552_03125 [Pseudomonadota bacterium]